MVMKKRSPFWSVSIPLTVFVLLAVVGVLANLSTSLMVIGCASALAWWDLTHFGESLVAGQPPEATLQVERVHLQSLALAISAGLTLALVSSYLDLQIPFLGMALLALFAIGCLTYAVRSLVAGQAQ
jgi:hypothetical protein